MSRNLRQKPAAVILKATKRRGSGSSSSNLSDDDGYSGVDEVSDSEDDDEEDVDAAEEEHIITDELHPRSSSSPRPASDDGSDEDAEDEDEDEEDENDQAEDGHVNVKDVDDDNASWDGIVSDVDETASDSQILSPPVPRQAVERHVRFVDVPDSESDTTETDDDHADFFPDIFVDQSSLDPAFRREIELDPDESSGSGSYWDYHGTYDEHNNTLDSDMDMTLNRNSDEETPVATPIGSQGLSSDASTPIQAVETPQDLDGYETDGDTTEEDVPEPPVRRKTRRPEHADVDSDSEAGTPVKFRRGQPRVGRFNLDKSDRKPIAVVNPISRKMMIFTPHRRRQLDLSPEQFNFQFFNSTNEHSSPILSNSASLMMSAMFSSNTFGDFMNSQAVGPAEAFFPFFSEGPGGEDSLDSSVDGDEDDAERNLDITDFITWDEGDVLSDSDDDGGVWVGPDGGTPVQSRPTTASSDAELLPHLTPETVGAFRRNQINQQLLLSSQATQDSLAFSGPYNYTALRGLKSDRFSTATVPLTPTRRRKNSTQDIPTSPLEAVAQKRKASGDIDFGHKRHRSISDVNLLRI